MDATNNQQPTFTILAEDGVSTLEGEAQSFLTNINKLKEKLTAQGEHPDGYSFVTVGGKQYKITLPYINGGGNLDGTMIIEGPDQKIVRVTFTNYGIIDITIGTAQSAATPSIIGGISDSKAITNENLGNKQNEVLQSMFTKLNAIFTEMDSKSNQVGQLTAEKTLQLISEF